MRLPLFLSRIDAGFPSPADDHLDQTLDLNDYLIRHPAATFFLRVQGDSMTGAGIYDGDLLVVDRSLEPRSESIVVAALDGDLTVKRLRRRGRGLVLAAAHPDVPPLPVGDLSELVVWGVATHTVHLLR